MRREFFRFLSFFWLLFALFSTRESAHVFASEFSVVASDAPLQRHLQTVRAAGWSGFGTATSAASTSASLTRYEIALETAKALIAVRARHEADESWSRDASPQALRALRSLSAELKTELAGFEVNIPATLQLLDELIERAAGSTPASSPAASLPATPVLETAGSPQIRSGVQPPRREYEEPSFAQRFRVYSALDSLARSARDPYASRSGHDTIFTARSRHGFDATSPAGVKQLRAGAAFDVNRHLRLRADFERVGAEDTPARAPGLREFLAGAQADSAIENSRSVGAGADLMLRPGIVLSGDVARVDAASPFRDGLRFEGGLDLSGWENRVVLSAHLSRLVPEDSLALGTTAARLNLGVDVTSQVQLTLMYQQLFGAGATQQGNRRFGGGIDFNF